MNILSVFLGFALLGWGAWVSVEDLRLFWNPQGLLMVFGATLVASVVAFRFSYVFKFVFTVMTNLFGWRQLGRKNTVRDLAKLNDAYRSRSMVLGEMVNKSKDRFLREAMGLLLEGIVPPEKIQNVLETRAKWFYEQEVLEARRVRSVGRYAWAASWLAFTVTVMSVLSHPPLLEGWGPSLNGMNPLDMLPYFVSSFACLVYGFVARFLVFAPISENLQFNADDHYQKNKVVSHGVALMAQQVNPLHFTEELNSYLAPRDRIEWKAA